MQQILTSVGVGAGTGIVSLGILWILFRRIFAQLDSKVDQPVFNEYALRIAENLERGSREFDKMEKTTAGLAKAVTELCKATLRLELAIKGHNNAE